MKSIKKILPGVAIVLVLTMVFWLLTWWLDIWSLESALGITLSIACSVLPAIVIAWLSLFLLGRRKKTKPVNEDDQRQFNFMQQQTAVHFDKVGS